MSGFDGAVKRPPAGGEVNFVLKTVDTLYPIAKGVPNYPLQNYRNSLVVMNDGNILAIGGRVTKNCFILTENSWKHHSTLSKFRNCGVAVTMPNGVYVFGGYNSYDYTFDKDGNFNHQTLDY